MKIVAKRLTACLILTTVGTLVVAALCLYLGVYTPGSVPHWLIGVALGIIIGTALGEYLRFRRHGLNDLT